MPPVPSGQLGGSWPAGRRPDVRSLTRQAPAEISGRRLIGCFQGRADRRHEHRQPQRPDLLAGEDVSLTAPCVGQADRVSTAMTASGPSAAASSTRPPISAAASALTAPSDKAIPIHPDLHASTPRTRQPFTAPSWIAVPGGTTFRGDAPQLIKSTGTCTASPIGGQRNLTERKSWPRDDSAIGHLRAVGCECASRSSAGSVLRPRPRAPSALHARQRAGQLAILVLSSQAPDVSAQQVARHCGLAD
jgi:hypothetical protein